MDNLEKLEIYRLLNEFNFVKSDYEYKSELINNYELEFNNRVNNILEKHTGLKQIIEEKDIHKKVDIKTEEELEYNSLSNKSPKIKYLYRQIAKITHNDITKNNGLNDIYIKSKQYYEDDDIIGIYSICDRLGIDYELDVEEKELIIGKISEIKKKIDFIETTFIWEWKKSNDDEDKNKIILSYIKGKIT